MKGLTTCATLALLLAATGCGSSGDTTTDRATTGTATAAKATTGPIDVVMKEFTLVPAPAATAAGKVTFNVSNKGRLKHEFVVVKTDKPADQLLKGSEADETGNVGEIGDLPPGSSKNLSLMLKAGHYALICNVKGHYKAGQHADFTVK
jgi:uncharacterized cupredoxin-like copper-binding protein